MKNILIFIIAIVIAGGSGFALQKYLNKKQEVVNPAIGNQRPEFAAIDLDGQMRNIKEWDGKLILVNFWATWCPPCIKEIPDLIDLQQAYGDQGFQIVGVAIDDEEPVKAFAKDMGMNYPSLLAGIDGTGLVKRFGNGIGALPYSVFINREGEISDTIRGELSKMHAKEILDKHGINL
jgi:thiol-disulfide isomerase/thioredoxin